MIEVYFVKSSRVGGQMKLKCLPGQTTYCTLNDQHHALQTDKFVQPDRANRTFVINHFPGTIFAIAVEGANHKACRLQQYARDNDFYYAPATPDSVRYYALTGSRIPSETEIPAEVSQAWANYQRENVELPLSHDDAPAPVQEQSHEPFIDAQTRNRRLAALDTEIVNAIASSLSASEDFDSKVNAILRLRDSMTYSVVKFEYTKQNGDRRVAYGTLCPEVFGVEHRDSDNSNFRSCIHFRYFDMQRRDWRMFCIRDFIGMMGVSITGTSGLASIPSLPAD